MLKESHLLICALKNSRLLWPPNALTIVQKQNYLPAKGKIRRVEMWRKNSPQGLVELEGTLVTGSRWRSLKFAQGEGGRAREVG